MTELSRIEGVKGPATAREVAGSDQAPAPREALPAAAVLRLARAYAPPEVRFPPGASEDAKLAAAAWGTPEILVAAARSGNLPPQVSRAVFDRGNWSAMRSMARDATTVLPADVAEGLVAASRDAAGLREALSVRTDLPPDVFARLRRGAPLPEAPEAPARPGEGSGIRVKDLRPETPEEAVRTRWQKADAAVDVLAKLRPLRPADIAYCLSLGRTDEAMAVIARMVNVPTPAAIRAYEQGDVGYAMQQMQSIGLDPMTANWLLRSVNRVQSSPSALATARQAYGSAPDPDAETSESRFEMRI